MNRWTKIKLYASLKMLNPNAIDSDGNTPLHWAAMTGLLEVAVWLIDKRGAVLFKWNKKNELPIDLALKFNRREVYLYLKKKEVEVRNLVAGDRGPVPRSPPNMPPVFSSTDL